MTKVYMVMTETEIGPFFSTREFAEQYLDRQYAPSDWRAEQAVQGYPVIQPINIDDETQLLDR